MSTLFPGAVDDNTTLPNPTSSNPTNSPSLSTGQTNQNDAIKATQTKVLANDTTLSSHIANTSNPHSTTKAQVGLSNVDNVSELTILAAVYPVGSIYIETSGVNPNTTFGFGTWAAFGAGRTLIGVGTSDQAFAANATGGESNHLLTAAESGLPAHTHIQNFSTGANNGVTGIAQTVNQSSNPGINSGYTTAANTATAAASAHNTLPPYIVTYFWKRTA